MVQVALTKDEASLVIFSLRYVAACGADKTLPELRDDVDVLERLAVTIDVARANA